MLSRILVAIAGSPQSQGKLEAALALARRHRAAVTALSLLDVGRLGQVGPVPLGAEHHAQRLREHRLHEARERAEQALQAFLELGQKDNVPVEVLRGEGDPIELLISAWRYHDLCVLGARGWFADDAVGQSPAALLKVVAAGVRPLLALDGGVHAPVRRVLVAYNGSLESAKAMKQFAQMRLWPDVTLHVACTGTPKTGEAAQRLLEDAAAYLRGQGYPCATAHLEGPATEALPAHAAAIEADLVVLGSSFRKILLVQRFGTHALTLLKTAERPLFLSH